MHTYTYMLLSNAHSLIIDTMCSYNKRVRCVQVLCPAPVWSLNLGWQECHALSCRRWANWGHQVPVASVWRKSPWEDNQLPYRSAEGGHCQVARYLNEEVHMDPQDRDKVRGVPGDCAGLKVQGLNVSCTSAHRNWPITVCIDSFVRLRIECNRNERVQWTFPAIYRKSIGIPIFLAVTRIPEVSPVASIMLWLVTAYVMYPPYFQCGWTKYVHMLESFSATMQICMSDILSAISCPLGLSNLIEGWM